MRVVCLSNSRTSSSAHSQLVIPSTFPTAVRKKEMSTIGRLQRYVGLLRPPIHITISSPGDNDYQELKFDSNSLLSRSPSPRSSNDDYPPFLPSPVSRTVSNDFSDGVSDLVWLKLKIRNRTILGIAYPRIIPRSTWSWGRRALIQKKPRCTRRQCLAFLGIVILLSILIPVGMMLRRKAIRDIESRRGWGYGMPGMDENGWPMWEFTFKDLNHNYGGINELVPKEDNLPEFPPEGELSGPPTEISYSTTYSTPSPTPFNPYPDYRSESYQDEFAGKYVPCRSFEEGKVLDASEPLVKVFEGIPWRKSDPILGSSTLLGLNDSVCFERTNLLTPYGFGDDTSKELKDDWKNATSLSFKNVNWGELQDECVLRNKARFNPSPTSVTGEVPIWTPPPPPKEEKPEGSKMKRDDSVSNYRPRTAIVLRAWESFQFMPDDIINLRRMITELSLFSGGEYQIHIIVDVKNFDIPIWSDKKTYQKTLERLVPKEFWGITELVNEPMMAAWYWGAGWHDSYRSLFMPLQVFSKNHPEYDFVWQWEMDMRLIGDHYHFLETLAKWAKKQPRRELWERSTRHYVPSVHGTWEQYSKWVSSLYPEANSTIWGPVYPREFIPIDPPKPPTATPEEDNFEWGVGEEADLITLLPMFDPIGGTWSLRTACNGYAEGPETLPRRAAIVTASRLSKRLLWRMHSENSQRKHTCAAEMWPATTCLHHGLKAVYAPHPIWFERDWQNMTYVESVFNGGTKGAVVRESVFGVMEHNYSGTSWYFNTRWARDLYRRWMGYEYKGGGREWEKEHGNLCLNGVLLHPVKDFKP
ncbi:hypothetical protein ABW19_dt0201675 [Dactylella cylindrospora]|nr:hypothetical protein ABW19_dt0201675 [Dactylella cylindrospora]